ncbi:MAG: family 20 glycosylhydrolase, partial [Bacteroidota bacterium]
IYFNQISGPIPGKTTTGEAEITHINGDFYALKPSNNFTLKAGATTTIQYQGANWATKNSDAPNGVYVIFQDENGKEFAPQAVEDYTISPFAKKEQLNRTPADKFPIPTNEYRYNENAKLTKLAEDQILPLIPSPVKASKGTGNLELTKAFTVNYFGDLKEEADFLVAQLEALGVGLKTFDGGAKGQQSIQLSTISTPIVGETGEAYRLKIDPKKEQITIEGTDAAGVFYGIQSLLALLPNTVYQAKNSSIPLDELIIEDAPRFAYRGLMLDVSRNFHSKKVVKKLLDLMANYKLNKFHFHLTDDEGWRLEIPDLPELTEIGAKRGHTLDEKDRLQPAYGSGPTTNSAAGSGYYTVADYIDILQYAQARHIEVIPEIDVPGHSRSSIIPMRVRHDRLMAEGKAEAAKQYLLNDANDESEYRTAQSYNDNVINVCMESTYTFFEKVVDELLKMHETAGVPLKMVHTGGDEVPSGAWQKSPLCADLVANNGEIEGDVVGLTNYFLKRLCKILAEKNLAVGGWEEIGLYLAGHGAPRRPNPEFVNDRFVPFVWNSIFGWGGEDIAYQLANLGYPVVLCNASNLYFDLSYDKDPENAGLYWAGYVNTRTAYDFVPFDLFKTAQMGRYGEQLDRAALAKGKTPLNPEVQKNVLGIQGQLWSETLINPERLELSTFPKLLGLAERAWAQQPSWATDLNETNRFTSLEKDWNQFTNTIGQKEMTRMDYLSGGIGYYIPPAGAKIEDGQLYANTAFPGLTIRYTLDGSEPTTQSLEYTQPVEVQGDVRIKVFSSGGNSSRSILVKMGLVD